MKQISGVHSFSFCQGIGHRKTHRYMSKYRNPTACMYDTDLKMNELLGNPTAESWYHGILDTEIFRI